MENATKYHIIVKAKELLLELEIKDLNSLKNNNLISLNASKVFELVYNNKELEKFYTNKLNTYNKLKASNNEYINALNLRLKQLKECQPLIQFCLNPDSLIYEQALFDVFEQNKIETIIKRSYNEFTIRLLDNKLKILPYMNDYKGIFAFIDNILSNTKLIRPFSIWDKNEYTQSISQLYDYYFLLNYEKDYFNTGMVIEKENDLYAYISYRKILKDILEYLYTIDLSKEQKQEIEKEKKINIYLKQLTPKEQTLFKDIVNSITITVPDMAEKYHNSIRTIENHVNSISNKLTGKKGIKNLRTFIENEIFK